MTNGDPNWRRPGDEGMKIHCHGPYQCYCIARDEADRYQQLANAQNQRTAAGREAAAILLAQRNAASRIALVMRFGLDAVEAMETRRARTEKEER